MTKSDARQLLGPIALIILACALAQYASVRWPYSHWSPTLKLVCWGLVLGVPTLYVCYVCFIAIFGKDEPEDALDASA